MNNILTQHFTFIEDIEISLAQSILKEGDYVLELKSTQDTNYYQRIELTKDEILGIVGLVEKFGLVKPQYIVGHDPYKDINWSEQISKVAKYYKPNKQDSFAWKISNFNHNARVLKDCDLSTSDILVLDREWYNPGYRLWVKNFDGIRTELQILEIKERGKTTKYKVLDVNNTKNRISVGAVVIADYIDEDTEFINKSK